MSNENKPYVSNYPQLEAWLEKHKARCLWQIEPGKGSWRSFQIECWIFPRGGRAIIQIHSGRLGFNIFTQTSDPSIDVTFLDAEQRLGLTS